MFFDSWVLDWFVIMNIATLVLAPVVALFRELKKT